MALVQAIGRLVERIVIQSLTEVEGTDGGESSSTAATVATVWAEFLPRAVVERILPTSALGSQSAAMFRVRRRVDVTAKMRVVWTPTFPPGASQRTLEIRGVLPADDGRTWMYLDCTELTN